mmetsp:Transcript_47411/g.111739  ORF Transcript_47411/g.111739 Transcript_47411/m.111739 type:complete len:218 (+) Transcript_47411:224-877(+)
MSAKLIPEGCSPFEASVRRKVPAGVFFACGSLAPKRPAGDPPRPSRASGELVIPFVGVRPDEDVRPDAVLFGPPPARFFRTDTAVFFILRFFLPSGMGVHCAMRNSDHCRITDKIWPFFAVIVRRICVWAMRILYLYFLKSATAGTRAEYSRTLVASTPTATPLRRMRKSNQTTQRFFLRNFFIAMPRVNHERQVLHLNILWILMHAAVPCFALERT